MEEIRVTTSKFRIEKALKDLYASKVMLTVGNPDTSANRSYYAIFHALRAVLALDGFEAKKHSSIISRFIHDYIKSGVFDVSFSEMIRSAFRVREYADYQDFYIVEDEQAQEQINKAELIINTIRPYLESRWAEISITDTEEENKS